MIVKVLKLAFLAVCWIITKMVHLLRCWKLESRKKSEAEQLEELCKMQHGELFWQKIGLNNKQLIVKDKALIYGMFTKEFREFHDRGLPRNEKSNPLSAHLFSLEGERWKEKRRVVSPAFTHAKVRHMMPEMAREGEVLRSLLMSCLNQDDINILDFMERYAFDVTGSCCFGVRLNSLEQPNEMFLHCKQVAFAQSAGRKLRDSLIKWAPRLAVSVPYRQTSLKLFKEFVEVLNKDRRSNNRIKGNKDLFHFMMEAKESGGSQEDETNSRFAVAQTFATFRAAFEATAPTLTLCLIELACNQSEQEKLLAEIDARLRQYNDTEFTLEMIEEMKYLDCVVSETLRKYPPNAILARMCTSHEPYIINNQGKNDKLVIERGTKVVIPLYALHNDFPNPEKFMPERFLIDQEESAQVYLPFGKGPRMCPAVEFAITQVKIGLLAILKTFKIKKSENTIYPIHFEENRRVVLTPKHENCRIRIVKR